MSEDQTRSLKLMLSEDKKIFKCTIGIKKVKECVDNEIKQIKSLDLSSDTSKLLNLALINCLDAMLLSCIGKKRQKLDLLTSELDFIIAKNKKNEYEIQELSLQLNLKKENDILLRAMKQCFGFFNFSCISKSGVKFSVSFKKEYNNLSNGYKKELLDLKQKYEKIIKQEILGESK